MKRAKRTRTTTDGDDTDEVPPSDAPGDTAIPDASPVTVLGNGGADGEVQANPPKKRGRPPKQKGPQDGKEIHGDGKALLPEGCEVPVEVTPVLLIKNVFNAQGESVVDETKGEVLPGNSLQLLASVDAKDDTSKKPKVTPRRGRPPLAKKTDEDVDSGATKQEEKTKPKEVRRGRPPKYKTRKDSVDTVEEDGNESIDKSDVLSPKKTGSDGEESEKVLPLENSQPRVAKRGRPPKSAHTSLDGDKSGPVENMDTSAGGDLETASPPKKRGRGRPPKNRLSEDQANSAQKKPAAVKATPVRDADTPVDSKSSEVKKRAGRPRKTTENTESSNDTPAREPERKSDVAANIPLTDSASARRSRQLKAKKIFEDYEEYSPGKAKPKVALVHMTPQVKKVKKHGTPGRPSSKQVPVKALGHMTDGDSVNDSKLDDSEMTSPTSGGTSENDTSEGTEVFSIDPSNKSADHKQPSAAQVIIIKSKPKTDGSHDDNSKSDGQEVETKPCEKPAPLVSKQKNTVQSVPSKPTKVLPAQNRLPRQQRSARIPAKRQQQIASFKAEMCMAPEIKLDLPVSGLLDSVNMSTQPEIRTLYMFQNTSTNGWLKIICKRISGVQFYQCPLCPYKDPVPRKVADHLHEDHPSLVSIAEGKCTRIFATFLFMFCRHCDFIAYEKLALWYHFEQYHGLTDMINAKPIDPATINMSQFAPLEDYALKNAKIVLRCNECDFLSLSKRQAMLHVLKEHSGMSSCVGNGFVIISQLDAMSPPGEEGPPPSDVPNLPEELKSMVMKDCFICTECTFVTYKRALMEIHCVNNHAKRLLLLVCSVCGDQFDTTYKMSSHIATAHSESKRQFCTVTLVDADGKEDVRLHELAELRSGEAAVAAASHEPVEVPALSVDQPETKPVTTAQTQPWLTDAKSSPVSSHVSTVTMTNQVKPAKTRPVAIVSGSSCGQPPVQKVWPGQSLVKPQQQQAKVRSVDTVTSPSKQKATQLQAGTQHVQIAPNTLAKPTDGEKQLTYIQMPDGTHHQVELTEGGDGQLQYVLTNQRESETAADGDQMYVKLPDGSIQQLSSVAEGSQAAENAEEIRYLQLPDGSLQQLPAETDTSGEVHYVQLADGSLQQISSIPDTVPSTDPVQEVHYMKFPDGSLQQVSSDTQSADSDKNVRYVTLEDNAQSANETAGSGEQVHYGKVSDGSVQQLADGGQSDSAEKAAESGQEMHCIKLADGSLQPVAEGGQEVCYVKMPDGSIQQVAESVKGENSDGNVRSSEAATDGKTAAEHTEDGEQTTYVQYIIQMDNNEQSTTTTSEPQVAPPTTDRSKFTAAQASGGNRTAMVDQSGSSSVAESRSEGTKMVSLLSQDVLANVQAHQTVAAAAAPTEPGTQPMVMQAYNVNGETIILCCEPGMVITDQQAAQVIQAAPREAGSTTTSGQRILYVQNESSTGNFEDAFQTFVNSNSTQQ